MSIRNAGIAVAMVAMWSGSAHAVTGNDLVKWFIVDTETKTSFESGYLHGYIGGSSDSMDKVFFCLPDGVTYRQISAITKKYLDQNPKRLHETGSRLVKDALAESFPCKN
ncbi:Rap1a/Tai family immunity protein [Pseudomonas plecoglossicida]|uniref:Rap1a/Tai family immunity protein n=1 Tax=Pseudomonas putida group TaxID=136845 RepID=UPI00240F657D|nr:MULTISPECIES: Rap1a/Tai family immunity protein [Pseudomonas putida group]MDQ7965534.1 Rap1a/Tai family immunity protein [Pseudomonas plecoglossicida]WFG03751.1 Rap1a/Tai family immunity protein [Pseudomonas putida]